ncbi:hypothetical protein AB0L41_46700 [Amycolatopsis mediterranei]|uniref:hypothetical protein n=1 Tax=Amycolatopsis mediterranei TaxID=33910 RepID=UPI003415C63B
MTATERIHVDHSVAKHLGNWTRADHIEVRARRGAVVVDLRSPDLPDEIEIRLDLHHAMVKLLVGDDVTVSRWDLGWTGKGKIKDSGRVPATGTRTVRLLGAAADSEVRVHRGGIAILSAMCSRAYLQDLRRARATGDAPTVDDPARTSH